MNQINISNLDLNLLVVFNALIEERNTVRAASRLSLSQPAISHALNRIRDMVGDQLFVRAPRGLVPTPRALEMAAPVREILEKIENVIQPRTFDPATIKRTFRIATTDYFEQVALPSLLKEVSIHSPGITIITLQTGGSLPEVALASDCDLAIAGFYRDVPDRFFKQKLFVDEFVCVSHGARNSKITLEQYAEKKHLVVSPQGDLQTKSRELMKKKGYDLQYSAGVSSFAATAAILANSDLLLTCPRRLAVSFKDYYPLKTMDLPFHLPGIQVDQVWHERMNEDPGHKWLRGLIHQTCSTLK